MEILAYTFVGIYLLALAFITIYAILEFHLLFLYLGRRENIPPSPPDKWPKITIQLPIYNELYVVERLIDAICKIDYPSHLLEIQVLDDSTDETKDLIEKKCVAYQNLGRDIKAIHRIERSGFKAGALKEGLEKASGEFITIFDADFLPQVDFLKTCIPYFNNPKTGVVQTRWDHLNENYSMLTILQAFQLNVHFSVEQSGRQGGELFLQFNGTAGTWRKSCIEDAGGWHYDTLTEDLDLSIRAQMKGWNIIYLQNVGSPAELPAEMNGLKSQQARWMKGGAETARKLIPFVLYSSLSFGKKIHTVMMLLASSIFVFVLALAISSVPIAFSMHSIGISPKLFSFGLAGLLSILIVHFIANYTVNQKNQNLGRSVFRFIFIFPLFLTFSMGLSLHNTIAVVEGWLGKKTAFVRTPKFNIKNMADRLANHKYLSHKLSWTTFLEGILSLYFLSSVYYGYQTGQFYFIAFHIALSLGFGSIFFYTLRHSSLKD